MIQILNIAIIFSSIMCIVDAKCARVYESGITNNAKTRIVELHNQYRLDAANGRIPGQPRACNLKKLEWDDGLALKAQRAANTCVYRNRKVRDDRWKDVGQNTFVMTMVELIDGDDWDDTLQRWFNFSRAYKYGQKYSQLTYLYTQLVWANTEYVGCGYQNYLDPQQNVYKKMYVCNYGPSENIYRDRIPYEIQQHYEPCGCTTLC